MVKLGMRSRDSWSLGVKSEQPDLPIIAVEGAATSEIQFFCSGFDNPPDCVYGLVDAYVSKSDGITFLISTLRAINEKKQPGVICLRKVNRTA